MSAFAWCRGAGGDRFVSGPWHVKGFLGLRDASGASCYRLVMSSVLLHHLHRTGRADRQQLAARVLVVAGTFAACT